MGLSEGDMTFFIVTRMMENDGTKAMPLEMKDM
jgi:hypothetical protein